MVEPPETSALLGQHALGTTGGRVGGIAGLVWASAAPLFVSGLDHDTILFLSVVLSGMAAAGAVVLASIPQAAIAYSLPICVAVVVVIVGTGDSILMMLGVMLVFFYYAVTTASRLVVLNATNALRDKYLESKEREFYQGRFADFAKSSADLFWEMDASRRYTFVSSALSEDAGQQTWWALGRSHDKIVAEFHDRSEWEPFYRAFDARRPFRDLVARRIGDDGGAKWIRSSGVPVFGADEIFQGYRGITSDVTSVMQVEQSLKESRHSLAEAQRTAHLGSWTLDVKTGEKTWSDEHFRIFGYEPHEITPTRHNFAAAVYPDDRERVSWHTEEVLIGKLPYDIEYRVVRLDGEIRNIHAQGVVERAAEGTPLNIVGTVQDNIERVQAEELLRQAQKMEAIGQLTGGIAHDFNNLLPVIHGNISLLELGLDADSESRELTVPALRAVERGASLTQRLLAFARRQPLRAEVIDAGDLIGGLAEMLRRSLGEDISIETTISSDHWHCLADPGQLEQAIINLANNARDAMPDGGKLSIEVSNIALSEPEAARDPDLIPGEYVLLAVTDTGSGIAPELREKIFEPFFTTKGIGRGTGLGLSMVYGFAKQSGGHMTVHSEVDKGTTFNLYLPRSHESQRNQARPVATKGGNETILVVEDDDDLRTLMVAMLSALGYRVLAAGSGPAALALLARESQIDLLLTDVVLPEGMGGKSIAEAVQSRISTVKVLYMSGYTEGSIVRQGRLEPGVRLLVKPFTSDKLAEQVRSAIDS